MDDESIRGDGVEVDGQQDFMEVENAESIRGI